MTAGTERDAELEQEKLVELKGITKTFGGVHALDGVDFEVYDGEIVALLGDNGAGKSTLIKIMSGAYMPDAGEICFEGKKVEIRSPIDAMGYGIETIYQDLALFDNLTASANLFIGKELTKPGLGRVFGWMDRGAMERETGKSLEKLSIGLGNPHIKVQRFSGGQRQGIALGRAIMWGKKLVLLDEPTAALGVKEAAKLLSVIKSMISLVRGIVVISHNMEHVIDIADRAVVLRRGTRVGEMEIDKGRDNARLHNELVSMITGKVAH